MKFNSFNQNKKSQRGVSLFDFVLWIAIAGAFIASIYAIYGPSRAQTRAQSLLNEIQISQLGIQGVYSSSTTGYTFTNIDDLITEQILPTSIKKVSNGVWNSTEGGSITIATDTSAKFVITYSSINFAACNLIVGKLNQDSWLIIDGSRAGTATAKFTACEESSTESGKAHLRLVSA
jgi:hypothetical protein